MRVAVGVTESKGLESGCAECLEAARWWVIVEMQSGSLDNVQYEDNPFAMSNDDGAALAALELDVVLCQGVSEATRDLLLAQGIRLEQGTRGTARRALIDYVAGGRLL